MPNHPVDTFLIILEVLVKSMITFLFLQEVGVLMILIVVGMLIRKNMAS